MRRGYYFISDSIVERWGGGVTPNTVFMFSIVGEMQGKGALTNTKSQVLTKSKSEGPQFVEIKIVNLWGHSGSR